MALKVLSNDFMEKISIDETWKELSSIPEQEEIHYYTSFKEFTMSTNINLWFRLKSRTRTNRRTGIIETQTKKVLITMKGTYGNMNVELSTGYYTDSRFWDQESQRVMDGYDGEMTAADINNGLQFLECIFYFTVRNFERNGIRPIAQE